MVAVLILVLLQRTNRPASTAPPSPATLLSCLESLVAAIRDGDFDNSVPPPSTQSVDIGPPMQPQVTSAGVKIFPNAGFNMDDYTTKLDTSALSDQQIRAAELMANEIEREKRGAPRGGWHDGEGDWGMVSWE